MVNPRLVNYIKTQLSRGFSVDRIKEALVSKGWKIQDVSLAVMMVKPQSTNNHQPTYQKPDNQSSNLWMLLAFGIIFGFSRNTENKAPGAITKGEGIAAFIFAISSAERSFD